MSFEMKPLSSLIELQRGHDLPSRDRTEGPVPIIGSFGVTGWHAVERYAGPGVAIGRSGASIGRATYVNQPYWPLNTCLFVRDFKGNDPRWVYWMLHNLDFSAYNSGSAQPSLNRNYLAQIEIRTPSVRQQALIGEMLGALEDKIAANRRSVRAADNLARARASFAAAGSPQAALGDVCTMISRGVAPRYADDGFLVLNQKCVREGRVDLQKSRTMKALPGDSAKILQSEDVLVNSTGQGTLGRVARWTKPNAEASVDSHISIVRVDKTVADPSFVGTLLLDYESRIEALAEGSTGQTELGRQSLTLLPLRLPSLEEQQEVGELVRSLSRLMDAKEAENLSLAATRDELLPLLMSGKITVKAAEKTVEEVV